MSPLDLLPLIPMQSRALMYVHSATWVLQNAKRTSCLSPQSKFMTVPAGTASMSYVGSPTRERQHCPYDSTAQDRLTGSFKTEPFLVLHNLPLIQAHAVEHHPLFAASLPHRGCITTQQG